MDRYFDFGWVCGCLSFDLELNFFPCEQTVIRNILAFLNGGISWGSRDGYWFISDQGLLHFAFLVNKLDNYQAKWRLSLFSFQESVRIARDYKEGF